MLIKSIFRIPNAFEIIVSFLKIRLQLILLFNIQFAYSIAFNYRCMHNYNGVLQICAAFVNASVYRLKKTWEKIAKQVKPI